MCSSRSTKQHNQNTIVLLVQRWHQHPQTTEAKQITYSTCAVSRHQHHQHHHHANNAELLSHFACVANCRWCAVPPQHAFNHSVAHAKSIMGQSYCTIRVRKHKLLLFVGSHLQNLSVLHAARMSSRSEAVLPVTCGTPTTEHSHSTAQHVKPQRNASFRQFTLSSRYVLHLCVMHAHATQHTHPPTHPTRTPN